MTNLTDENKQQLERRLHRAWNGSRRKKGARGKAYQIFLILAAIALTAVMIYMLVTI